MKVKITSFFTGDTWTGVVPVLAAQRETQLDLLFRYFNRVDEQDVQRLAEIDYTLPSMSMGDLVEIDGEVWRSESIGWKQLSSTEGSAT